MTARVSKGPAATEAEYIHPPIADMKALALHLQKDKGDICVSIVLPVHKRSPERGVSRAQLEKAVMRAKEELWQKYGGESTAPLIAALDEMRTHSGLEHNGEGLGLYISSHIRQRVVFHTPVKARVVVDRRFEIRDLLYEADYARPYRLLLLSEKGAHLFNGRLDSLHEIRDGRFPMTFVDDHLYAKPSRGSSLTGNSSVREFEKDKSVMQEIRLRQWISHVHKELKAYAGEDLPLIVAGAKKDLACFSDRLPHLIHVIAQWQGSRSHTPTPSLGTQAWKIFCQWVNDGKRQVIDSFRDKKGEGRCVTGVRDIWKAAQEGRGWQLLIEKDFSLPGFLASGDDYHLYLRPPVISHTAVEDALDDLMGLILEKGGKVIVVENEALMDCFGVGLITRY